MELLYAITTDFVEFIVVVNIFPFNCLLDTHISETMNYVN